MRLTDGSFLLSHKETLWVNVLFCVFLMAKQNLGEVGVFFGGLQALPEHQGSFLPSWGQRREVASTRLSDAIDAQPFVPNRTDAAWQNPNTKAGQIPPWSLNS